MSSSSKLYPESRSSCFAGRYFPKVAEHGQIGEDNKHKIENEGSNVNEISPKEEENEHKWKSKLKYKKRMHQKRRRRSPS